MKESEVRESPISISKIVPSSAQEASGLSDLVHQALAFIRRGWSTILLCALGGLIVAGLMLAQLDRRYQSTVRVMIDQPQRSPIESEQLSAALLENFVEGQVFLVESAEVLLAVVQRENLTEHPFFQPQPPGLLTRISAPVRNLLTAGQESTTENEDVQMNPAEATALRELRRNLAISRERRANVIRIDVTADTARTAARTANAIAEVFVETRVREQTGRATQMADWLDDRARDLQDRVTRAEGDVADFRIENNLLSGPPGTTLSDQQLNELTTELIRTRTALAEQNAAYMRAETLMETGGDMQTLPEIQASEIVTSLRTQLLELERREVGLSVRTGASSRLGQLSEQRAALETQLENEVSRIVAQMRNEVETLRARESLVATVLAEAGGESGVASRLSVQLRELERRAAAYQALYERYLSSGGLAEEAASFLPVGVSIIDRATLSNSPVFPPGRVILLFGLLLGGGLGALIAFFRDVMRTGYLTAHGAESDLALPVLASIPQLQQGAQPFDHTVKQPFSPFSDSIRTLRDALRCDQAPNGGKVLTITSSSAGEGKTNIAAALAASAVRAGLQVLLVDADLRRSGLTRLFGMEGEAGLAEILRGEGWTLAESASLPELDILSAGVDATEMADRLANDLMTRFLQDARAHYDLVILDCPPVANLADAPILARKSDAVAFVIRWNITPREVVRKALGRLGRNRVQGLVLNDVDFTTTAQYGDSYESYVQMPSEPARKRSGAVV